jgi:hypothetical protein
VESRGRMLEMKNLAEGGKAVLALLRITPQNG